ncbi:MAG: hypothetical protein IPK88_17875 [Saprospiraceae bacterium]|nr:hypothetical protein [Candidatus Defluviibacterium haderslevense]
MKRKKHLQQGNPKVAKESKCSFTSTLLIQPPGWTYLPGGIYFSLPLLKGFLENSGLNVSVLDLNIEFSHRNRFSITAAEVNKVGASFNLETYSELYYRSEDRITEIVSPYNAIWDIQSGFNFTGCNLKSSESIREFSFLKSPFDEMYLDTLLKKIQAEDIPIIGFSIIVPSQLLTSLIAIRVLRNAGYLGKIIVGGNMITRLGDDFIKKWIFELIDAAVLFQGEKCIAEYVAAHESNSSLSSIPNLIWKDKNGIQKNRIEYLKPTEFGRPSYNGIENEKYWGNQYLPILGSRGCYYGKCTFCAIPYAYGNNGFLGNDKPINVFTDIQNGIATTGIRNFKFVDEALHPTILRKLSDDIIKQRVECSFEGYARLDNFWMDSKFLKLVSAAGLKKVYIGLELINSTKRDLLNKSDSDKAIELLKAFADKGIKTHLFTLFGYPGTGVEEAMNTIEFCLNNSSLIDSIDVFPFYFAKHTQVGLIDKKLFPNEDWAIEYDYLPAAENVLTQMEVETLCNELEEVVWAEQPQWLHPIYRMFSPWKN